MGWGGTGWTVVQPEPRLGIGATTGDSPYEATTLWIPACAGMTGRFQFAWRCGYVLGFGREVFDHHEGLCECGCTVMWRRLGVGWTVVQPERTWA